MTTRSRGGPGTFVVLVSRPHRLKQEDKRLKLPPWKKPDLTVVLLTIVGLTILFIVTFELWFSHGSGR